MSFHIVNVILTPSQISAIKEGGLNCSHVKLTLGGDQLQIRKRESAENVYNLPLTSFQYKMFEQARASNNNLTLMLSLHEIKQFLESQFGIDTDISTACIFYQHRKRIFKKT
jgi:hypothetical protein